jgi:hypothetical protein
MNLAKMIAEVSDANTPSLNSSASIHQTLHSTSHSLMPSCRYYVDRSARASMLSKGMLGHAFDNVSQIQQVHLARRRQPLYRSPSAARL